MGKIVVSNSDWRFDHPGGSRYHCQVWSLIFFFKFDSREVIGWTVCFMLLADKSDQSYLRFFIWVSCKV